MDPLLKSFSRRDKLIPLNELSRNDREYLFDNASVWPLQPKTLVTPEGQSVFYLLEGEISLFSGGFVVESFTHADRRALSPLFDEEKEEDAALITSHGAILEIERDFFDGLYAQARAPHCEPGREQLEWEETRLLDELILAYRNGKLPLPALPEAALKIRQLINQPDIGSTEIIRIVQSDPVLSARLVKVANSPLYGTWRQIKTVRDAVRRLGVETTRNLSFSLSVGSLFDARSSLVKEQIRQMYEESIHVSALAYLITRDLAKHLDPEQALLAGLLHQLAMVPILKFIDERPSLVSSSQSIRMSISNLCLPISRMIFKLWHFDDEFLTVVEHASDWYRDSGEPADYADVVMTARLIYLDKSGSLDESIDFRHLPVVEKLGLFDIDDEGLDFLDRAEREVGEMQRTLGA